MDQTVAAYAGDDPELQALVSAQVAEVAERYRAGSDPGSTDADPPVREGVRYLGLRRDGALIGCVAVQPLESGVGEIKRMYVVPGHRGLGLGRTLLGAAEEFARRWGYSALRLETGDAQPEAVALYDSSGWTRIPSYGYWRDSPRSICFEKRLAPQSG